MSTSSPLWKIEPTGLRNDMLGEVWLAGPVEEDKFLVLAGHIERGDALTKIKVEQAGAVLAERAAAPGFCLTIPLQQGLYMLSLWHNDERLRQWEILPAERVAAARDGMVASRASATSVTGVGQPYAILGRMGDLFLAGDSNDSVSQFIESRRLSPSAVAAWENVFSQFPTWRQQFSLEKISLLVAPAKEEIRREYYPFARAQHTLLDDFMAHFRSGEVIFPKWELWGRRDLAYSNTDTHWTDLGATAAALALLRAWELPITGLSNTFQVCQCIGDLGNKIQPKLSSFELCFLPEVKERKIFDNQINNQGNIRIYLNNNAKIREKVFILGDSFGTNLSEALTGCFSHVFYAYQPAGFDPELVSLIRPKYVLLQIAQRFLHGHPATGKPVLLKAQEKTTNIVVNQKAVFLEGLKKLYS